MRASFEESGSGHRRLKIWYDPERDYLEVIFDQSCCDQFEAKREQIIANARLAFERLNHR